MEQQEQPESNPVIEVKPEIRTVYLGLKRVLTLEEMEKTGNAPAGGDDGNAGYKDTDAERQYRPVNVYIQGRPLKYCHSTTLFLSVSVPSILGFCNPNQSSSCLYVATSIDR